MIAEKVCETFAYDTFMASSDVAGPMQRELLTSAVVAATIGLTTSIGVETVFVAVDIVRCGDLKDARLVAKKAPKPQSLALAPLTTSASRAAAVAAQVWAPTVVVGFWWEDSRVLFVHHLFAAGVGRPRCRGGRWGVEVRFPGHRHVEDALVEGLAQSLASVAPTSRRTRIWSSPL
jgi:hypothetical protein